MSPRSTRHRWIQGLLILLLATVLTGFLLLDPSLSPATLEARWATAPSQFVELAGQRTHVRDEGSGPCLLLVHGTASSLHTWDGWVAELADDYRILRLDLPGYGLTGADHDLGTGTAHRLAVLDALRQWAGEERCSVAGNSLGGLVAWRYALEHPQRVDRLVLVDSAGFETPGGGGRVLDLIHVPGLNRLLTRMTPRWLVARGLRQVYADPGRLDPEVIDRSHQLLRREGTREAMVAAAMGGADESPPSEPVEERLARIEAPTLVLWGALDTWIPVDHAHRFHAALPNSELEILDDAGHVPMEELPVETAQRVDAFLRSASPVSEALDPEIPGAETSAPGT